MIVLIDLSIDPLDATAIGLAAKHRGETRARKLRERDRERGDDGIETRLTKRADEDGEGGRVGA